MRKEEGKFGKERERRREEKAGENSGSGKKMVPGAAPTSLRRRQKSASHEISALMGSDKCLQISTIRQNREACNCVLWLIRISVS